MSRASLKAHSARQDERMAPGLEGARFSIGSSSFLKWFGVLCLFILVLPNLLSTGTGAGQRPANKQGVSAPKDEKYYDRLLDSTFYDVERVMELGMDYALTYKAKVEQEFMEWVTGRSLKTPEQEDYFQAMHTLN